MGQEAGMTPTTIKDQLEQIRKLRIWKRGHAVNEFVEANHVSLRTAYRWVERLRQGKIVFDDQGRPKTNLRRDRGIGKKHAYGPADIPRVKRILADPDRTQKSIGQELGLPRRFVQDVASGRFD